MKKKLSVEHSPVEGKRVFLRVDFNVPLAGGKIVDDNRIRRSLPTIRHLLARGARPILASHLGRPKGKYEAEYAMAAVAVRTAELLGHPVKLSAPGLEGSDTAKLARTLAEGEVLLLENLRFHPGEEAGDAAFAKSLAALAEFYVNDAFGACHRPHASITGVPRHLPAAAGILLRKELEYVDCVLGEGERPFVAVLGGAKVADKIGVIERLIGRVDVFLVGGAMAYTFLAARGEDVGGSRVEKDKVAIAREILSAVARSSTRLLLPTDHVAAVRIDRPDGVETSGRIPAGKMGVDIGPETALAYEKELALARTILFNGPMGVFETPAFAQGTKRIVRALAASDAVTVVGGGDSAHAVEMFGAANRMSHISTGGGAFLEILAAGTLPGVEALPDAPEGGPRG